MVDLDAQFDELVQRLSGLESIADQPLKFKRLDRQLVEETSLLRQHLVKCKQIAELEQESLTLDKQIDEILIQLARTRKELVELPSVDCNSGKVDAGEVLDYATRITKFTRATGAQQVLPWTAEDMLRRGMLATLAINKDDPEELSDSKSPAADRSHAPEFIPEDTQNVKISLDFDSD